LFWSIFVEIVHQVGFNESLEKGPQMPHRLPRVRLAGIDNEQAQREERNSP
jgi:hypothetical protein